MRRFIGKKEEDPALATLRRVGGDTSFSESLRALGKLGLCQRRPADAHNRAIDEGTVTVVDFASRAAIDTAELPPIAPEPNTVRVIPRSAPPPLRSINTEVLDQPNA